MFLRARHECKSYRARITWSRYLSISLSSFSNHRVPLVRNSKIDPTIDFVPRRKNGINRRRLFANEKYLSKSSNKNIGNKNVEKELEKANDRYKGTEDRRDVTAGGSKGVSARDERKEGEARDLVYSVHNGRAECITVNTRKGPARSFSRRSRQLLRLARGINHLSRRRHAYPEDAERASLPYGAW